MLIQEYFKRTLPHKVRCQSCLLSLKVMTSQTVQRGSYVSRLLIIQVGYCMIFVFYEQTYRSRRTKGPLVKIILNHSSAYLFMGKSKGYKCY